MSGDVRAVGVGSDRRAASAVTTVAVVFALVLGWRSVQMLMDVRSTAAQLRLETWFDPAGARLVAAVVGGFGIVAAGLLLHPRTRALGGWLATGGFALLAGYLIATWLSGDPVGCLCTISGRRGDGFTRGESIVIALAGAGIAVGIALGSRSRRAACDGGAAEG